MKAQDAVDLWNDSKASWDPDTDPHTVYRRAYIIQYWKGNSACGRKNADRAQVSKLSHSWYKVLTFKLPEQKSELED